MILKKVKTYYGQPDCRPSFPEYPYKLIYYLMGIPIYTKIICFDESKK